MRFLRDNVSHSKVDLFGLDPLSGVIANDLEEPSSVEVLKCLGDPGLDLSVPRVHVLRLALVRNVEDVEALLEVEYLSHALEIDQ